MTSYCYDCGTKVPYKRFRCNDCLRKILKPEEFVRRRPLTEKEARKLRWYKNEKVWLEDIKSRKVLPDGRIAITDHKGNIREIRS